VNVIVAGGAGFLGSHLVDAHVKAGDKVIVFDDFSTGNHRNLESSLAVGDIEIHHVDISNEIPDVKDVEIIYNFASPASPPAYLERPFETLAVGSLGTKNLLDIALATGSRFVMASTSEIYGDPLVHPQKEEYRGNVDPIGPRSVYDEAKRFAESMTATYRRYHEVNTGILRIFNTYGPRLDAQDGRVVSNFIVQALSNEPLTVYGDGSQTRSLCYVSDLIDGIVKFGKSMEEGPLNLGNPDERTVLEIAESIKIATDSNSSIEFLPLPKDDPTRRCPDITKAKKLLRWEPVVQFTDGISRTIEYFRDHS
jgi:dTDP-glucose 4,6-dehydratase